MEIRQLTPLSQFRRKCEAYSHEFHDADRRIRSPAATPPAIARVYLNRRLYEFYLAGNQRWGVGPIALTFWQEGVPGGRSWDDETAVIWELWGVFSLSEEWSWFDVFSSEKAGCPFRRSETRLWAEFTPFHHPRAKLLLSRIPAARTVPTRCCARSLAIAHSADQRSVARREPRPPGSSPARSQDFRELQRDWEWGVGAGVVGGPVVYLPERSSCSLSSRSFRCSCSFSSRSA